MTPLLSVSAFVTSLLTCLSLTSHGAHADGKESNSSFVPHGYWSSWLWNRFLSEALPLFLTPYIEAGKIKEAQERSRVRGLQHEDVESYSGYITVDSRYSSNMFFWFFPAENKKADAPVLLWLNGGPGRTSMVGAVLENGPLQLTVSDQLNPLTRQRDIILKRREYSWTRNFSMIYVDNPVGVGYSFTKDDAGLSKDMQDVSRNLYSVLTQFFQLFPQYANNPFYVGGQSYAGKYVPSLGYYIHQRNQELKQKRINFKGIYVGAGYCSPQKMMPVFADFLFSMGFISDYNRRQMREQFSRLIEDGLSGRKLLTPTEYLMKFFGGYSIHWLTTLDHIMGEEEYVDHFFLRHPLHLLDSLDHIMGEKATVSGLLRFVGRWMNQSGTRIALHVGFVKHNWDRGDVRDALKHEFLKDTISENAFLMDNYKVLHYSGNLDVVVNVPMTEAFLASVPWSRQDTYNNSPREPWWVDGDVVGNYLKIDNFTRVVIRNSGHMAPADQPKNTLLMMENFVFDHPFRNLPIPYSPESS